MCFHLYTITFVRLRSHFKMCGWIWMYAKRWCRIKPIQITHNVSVIYLDDSFVCHSLWKRIFSESLPLKFCTKGKFLFAFRSELLLECYNFRNINDSWLVRFHMNTLVANITIYWHNIDHVTAFCKRKISQNWWKWYKFRKENVALKKKQHFN